MNLCGTFQRVKASNLFQTSVDEMCIRDRCKVLKDAGMNPIFQLACRDRNRIALESDLLSAAMLGIDNILCLTGDHTKMGDHPQAKPCLLYTSQPMLQGYPVSVLMTVVIGLLLYLCWAIRSERRRYHHSCLLYTSPIWICKRSGR